MSYRSPTTAPDLATLKKRLHAHQRRLGAIWSEATYYDESGYTEFRELAVKLWAEFEKLEVQEACLLIEVRAAETKDFYPKENPHV